MIPEVEVFIEGEALVFRWVDDEYDVEAALPLLFLYDAMVAAAAERERKLAGK